MNAIKSISAAARYCFFYRSPFARTKPRRIKAIALRGFAAACRDPAPGEREVTRTRPIRRVLL